MLIKRTHEYLRFFIRLGQILSVYLLVVTVPVVIFAILWNFFNHFKISI